MQSEKKYLAEEVARHLAKSSYVFLADFTGVTVRETEELRRLLAGLGAEFHVVKNRILKLVAEERNVAIDPNILRGPTAIIVGGNNAPGVAQVLEKFLKDKKKLELKGGALDASPLSPLDISELAKLPPAEVLKAQLLGLLNQPASMAVRVIQAVPQGLLNVLKAHSERAETAD